MKRWCPHCSTELTYCIIEKDGEQRQSSFASDSEPSPEPSAREADGERSTAFVGLQRAEASGGSSAIQPGGAGKATEGSAEPEAQRDERSQLPDGLPSRGDGESELLPCPFCGITPDPGHARMEMGDGSIVPAVLCFTDGCMIYGHAWPRSKWNKRAGNASVKPINKGEPRSPAGGNDGNAN